MERQATPLSVSGSVDDSEPIVKRSRNRKAAKKPIPHASTLHGLWGMANPVDSRTEAGDETNTTTSELSKYGASVVKAGQPLVFKITPSKLSAAVEFPKSSERMITPPPSLPDVVPMTPVQQEDDTSTPSTLGGRNEKKRGFQQSPSEGVRRSPRNHRTAVESEPVPKVEIIVKKPHPFFLGKEARMYY
jgi:hypothetical protein